MTADSTFGGSQNLMGRVIGGRYEVVGRLGKGGMAVVYRATDHTLGRSIAIKVLRTDVAKDPVASKRLVREARAAGQLHHPHIITMHDVGESDGMVYIVMEVLNGIELSNLMDELGPLGLSRSIEIARQAASGLSCAHTHRIIHRDIKPENLFVLRGDDGGDHVKILDFSIAKLPTNMVTAALTRAGSVFGTPHYMAPEQVEGREVTPQTDIYALGAVLYESLLGEPPFDGDSVIDILLHHVRSTAKRVDFDGRRLPAGLADLIESMLAKKESDRPVSAEEVERQLQRCLAEAIAIETPPAKVEMSTVEPATLDSDMTFRLTGDILAQIMAARPPEAAPPAIVSAAASPHVAAAAAASAPSQAAQDRPSPPRPAVAEPLPVVKVAPSLVAPAAARSGQAAPTGQVPSDLPGAWEPTPQNASPNAPEDDGGGRTVIGHGVATLVREQAAKIEAARAAGLPSPPPPPPALALGSGVTAPGALSSLSPAWRGASTSAPPPASARSSVPTPAHTQAPLSPHPPSRPPPHPPGAPRPAGPPPTAPRPRAVPPPPSAAPGARPVSRLTRSLTEDSRVTRPEADFEKERRHAASAATITVSAQDQAELAARVAAKLKSSENTQVSPAGDDGSPAGTATRSGLLLGVGLAVVIVAGAVVAYFILR